MIAGHFGLAAIVKSREPRVPLWALMLATQWMDVVFVPLLLGHAERLVPIEGTHGGYGEAVIYADYTHSLIGALVLSLVFALPAAMRWGRRSAAVLGAVVFSHWVLDLFVHRHDMPIFPGDWGDLPRLGFGLWRYPTLSMLSELVLVVLGAALYWRAAVKVAAGRGHWAGAMALAFGVITLAINVAGY